MKDTSKWKEAADEDMRRLERGRHPPSRDVGEAKDEKVGFCVSPRW